MVENKKIAENNNVVKINKNEIEIVTDKRIIDMVNLDELELVMSKINKFQEIVQKTLKPNTDYGIIPGTGKKPTLLKPGAEKILMLLGIRSEFDIADKTRDFDKGFFQYQLKCKLYKGDILLTEGLGACNTREKKYAHTDGFSVDNTVLKMAKKRALVDAALMVGSLSDLFTQDLEDMDLNGNSTNQKKIYTDQDGVISKKQAKRMFAISAGNHDLVAEVMKKYKYEKSANVKKIDYEKICAEIEKRVQEDLPDILKDEKKETE